MSTGKYSSSRILVTGGAGFIGSALIRYLDANTDCCVLNIDKLTYAGNLGSLQTLAHMEHHAFCQLDIVDAGAVDSALRHFRPDAVFHLAAESHVDRSIDKPDAFIQTNVIGTYNLLQSARGYFEQLNSEARDKFRFVHVSTDEVFGSLGLSDAAFTEESPYQPHSPYAATKASSDHLARAWFHTYGLPTIITNCSNNYGPYQFPEKLIPVVILKCLRAESIPVYGKGANVRDWLFVEDHAAALWATLNLGSAGDTYAIGGNNEITNFELVEMICGILDDLAPRSDSKPHASQISFVQDRPGHDLRYAINADKARAELNWRPNTTLPKGLRTTVQWYLEHQDWWQAILDGSYSLQRLGMDART